MSCPNLFSFLLDLLSPLFVLQAALFSPSLYSFAFTLFTYLSLFHCLPSSFFHDYCLLLFASPSVSISFTPEPPGVFCSLLILSDYTRQTLYKRWALFWTWPCTASFHTLQTPLSLHKSFKQPSGRVLRKGPPRVKERCERRTLSPHC